MATEDERHESQQVEHETDDWPEIVAGSGLTHQPLACGHVLAKDSLISSSLSHLFAQGVISAELLHMDEEFRLAVKERLSGKLEGSAARARTGFAWLYESPFQTTRCEVAYVIMAGAKGKSRPKPPALPFFSKVNLRQRSEELRRMGFAHSLTFV